jgi:hypothetical protein
METAGIEPTPCSVQARGATQGASPSISECGRVESNHHSQGQRGYSPLSSPVLSVRVQKERGRPDSNRRPLA